MNKVILILVDGMRPDAMKECGNPLLEKIMEKSTYCMNTQTDMPSVTLPCHFSLFYSVPSSRHGITTNMFTPMVRPLPGIYEQLSRFKKRNGIFYNWAELRDLARPGTYEVSYYSEMTDHNSDSLIAKHAIEEIKKRNLDFSFVYLGETDEFGHNFGWMSHEYLKSVNHAIDLIDEIMEFFPDHHIIITADHGGHGRGHGTDIPEDMTIPLILKGEEFKKNTSLEKASILDIAPTITDIIGVERAVEWEGTSVFDTFNKK